MFDGALGSDWAERLGRSVQSFSILQSAYSRKRTSYLAYYVECHASARHVTFNTAIGMLHLGTRHVTTALRYIISLNIPSLYGIYHPVQQGLHWTGAHYVFVSLPIFGCLDFDKHHRVAAGARNSNFNISKQDAFAHACGIKCQATLKITNAADLENVGENFDFDFYATAANFSKDHTKPGDVLKLQPLDPVPLAILSGTTVFRLQYASKDLDGSVIPSTGFIAFPYTAQHCRADAKTTTKYPLVAFAHGTIGLFAGCAPSNGPALYDYNTWQAVVSRGYAIVATDYSGLGNNYTTHKYLTLPAQVHDIYYAVIAARKLFGHRFTKEWASIGHSQGGGAVWKLAESNYVKSDKTYLGTVALSPATYIIDILMDSVAVQGFLGYLLFLPIAAKQVLHSYQETLLSATMRKRLQLAEKAQLCMLGMLGLSADLPNHELFSLSGLQQDIPMLLEWQTLLAPAQGDTSPAPILVIQGANDSTVLPSATERAWDRSCRAGNEVHLRLYHGQEHSPVVRAGHPEWLGWVDALFVGAQKGQFTPRCTKFLREPFNQDFVKQPGEDSIEVFQDTQR